MDINTAYLYSDLCRLCLENKGVNDLIQNKNLVQDIYLCTGVKVVVNNNWPRKICATCLEIVTNAKHLRSLAKANELRLNVLFDDDDLALHIDESHTNDKNTRSKYSDTSSDAKGYTDEEDKNIENSSIKRQRSSSTESVTPTKKIAVRKDLFNKSMPLSSPGESYTYIEGTKFGISKRYTVSNEKDVDVTYMCAWCPKTFTSWKKVYCHQRLHNKKLSCPVESCTKKFAAKGDLEKHVRTHTGERPFTCHVCDRSFSQQITLKVHNNSIQHKENILKKETEQQEENSDKDEAETLVVY